MTARPGAGEHRIGVSLANLDDPWQAQVKADIEAAAAKHSGWRLTVVDAQNDAARQQAQLEEFRGRRADLVIVNPVDVSAMTEPIARLFAAGIPVVVLDRAVIGDQYTCLIAGNPRQIGAEAGKWLAGRLHGKGKIVELRGPVDSRWADEVHEAFRAELRDPGYRLVFSEHVDPPRVDAGKLMVVALGRLEEIDAVFAYDDAAAHAAEQAAKAAGRGEWRAVSGRWRSAGRGRRLRCPGSDYARPA